MSEENTTASTRQTPGPMNTWIGKWAKTPEGAEVFTVLAGPIAAANPKQIKEAIAKLGFGEYDVLTGRTCSAVYAEKKSTSFSLS